MIVTIDGQRYSVPDNATPEQVQALIAQDPPLEGSVMDPLNKLGPIERAGKSLATGVKLGVQQAGNLAYKVLNAGLLPDNSPPPGSFFSDEATLGTSRYQGRLGKGHFLTGKVPGFVGSMAAQAPLVLATAGESIPAQMGSAALQGFVFSDPGQRETGALVGAGMGAAIPGIGRAIKSVARGPAQPSGAGKFLADRGYADDLTAGFTAPDSFWAHMENSASRVPILGRGIQNRQKEAKQAVLQPEMERWMNPVHGPQPPISPAPELSRSPTQVWFDEARGRISKAYGDFETQPTRYYVPGANGRFGAMQTAPLRDVPMLQMTPASMLNEAVASINAVKRTGMSTDAMRKANDVLQGIIEPMATKRGGVQWSDVQAARSALRQAKADYHLATGADDKMVLRVIDDFEKRLTAHMERPLGVAQRDSLRTIDRAYSNQESVKQGLVNQSESLGATHIEPRPLRQAFDQRISDTAKATGRPQPPKNPSPGDLARVAAQKDQQEFLRAADLAMSPADYNPAVSPDPYGRYHTIWDWAKAAAMSVPVLPFSTKGGQNFLKGQTPTQKFLADLLTKGGKYVSERDLERVLVPATTAMWNYPEEP